MKFFTLINNHKTQSAGFTLIELMMVVAIIGILSTVGMPAYREYTMKAKMAEATITLSAIQKSQISYLHANDYFLSLYRSSEERSSSKKKPTPFNMTIGWNWLGSPVLTEGDYYFTYSSLAGGNHAGGEFVMGTGSQGAVTGASHDGFNHITSRAVDTGNCTYTLNYSDFNITQVFGARWVVLFAAADFVKSDAPILCTTAITSIRLVNGEVVTNPVVLINQGT
ncbi:MAG: prepilin-type N-terminal cleavage/methylation domain-containing protein [Proteobacteria bacterium]|jgi:prepilin-type N-terminal cleavage/methylation domain-containing protein|nr:prepilin-type N-terminal cleavage/methylation domain-containing protein [Pseudomonadota bacterium]